MISDGQLRGLGLSAAGVRLFGPLIRAVVTVVVLAFAVRQVVVFGEIARTTVTVRQMADFGTIYRSGQQVLRGLDPYAESQSLGAGPPASAPNLNPPHVALLLAPLAFFAPSAALWIWVGASVASAVFALRIIVREVPLTLTPRTVMWIFLGLLFAAPTGALLLTAQSSWILWGPLTWAWAEARRGRCQTAAFALGLTAGVKPFLAVCALAFVARKRWTDAAIAAITTATCFAVGLVSLGWPVFRSWIHSIASITWAGHVFNASWFGVLERLLTNQLLSDWNLTTIFTAPAWVVPLWIVGGGAILLFSFHALAPDGCRMSFRFDVDRMSAVTLSAACLVSPLAWSYYQFWLAGPFVALFGSRDRWNALGWRRLILLLTVACYTLSPGTLTAGQPHGWATLSVGSAYFWGLAGLWFCAVSLPLDVCD